MVPTCAEAGVLGVLPGVIGMIQATEAIKLILGRGETLTGRLLLYDAMRMSFRELKLRRNQDCPVCGENPTITRLIDYEMFCNGGNRHAPALAEIGVAELRGRMERGDDFVLVDCRNPDEYELGHIDGSLLMPLPSFEQHLSGIEPHRNRTIIVYCQVGIRSAAACRILNQAGFEHPVNVRGGFGNWISSGFPVAR
jgi:adenylyltransferase/sulfurtransferase